MQNEKLKELIAVELCKQQNIGIMAAMNSYSLATKDGLFYSFEKVNEIKDKSTIRYDYLSQERKQRYLDIAEKLLAEALNGQNR